mgnify:CR=1 FL=1
MHILIMQQNKIRWQILFVLLFAFVLLLLPITITFASELGGYVSEKLVGMSGVSDSNLVIGSSGTTQSTFDIIMGNVEGVSVTYMNPTDPAYRLVEVLSLIFVAIVILGGLAIIMTGEFGLAGIILYALVILIAVAGLGSIQAALRALLGV